MKILLIQPKINKRPMDTDLKTRMSPPLGLLTLASLTPKEYEVTVINENVEQIDYDGVYDLVGITITLDVMPRATQIAERFRLKGIPVVAGGIHVTCSPNECLPYFDALCIGFAERVWNKIIYDAMQKKLKKTYYDMDNFKGEEIISPKYSVLDKSRYLYTNVISTSRGCPNKCNFCYNSCENRFYVRRPVKNVIRDIELLKTKHVLFIDDNFIGCPEYTNKLLDNLYGMDLKWSAAVTTKIAEYPDLLDLMAETGCQSLFIGFESINNESLKGVDKDNSFEKYERLVKEIHARKIMINASMVFGLDGDEADVFIKTLDWLVKNKIETLTSHILTPYPGTNLYKKLESENRITNYDLSKYNTAHVVFDPKNMSADELYKGYIWMYKQFYSFKNMLKRMPLHKKQRMPYFLFNVFYRKLGKFTFKVSRIIPLNTMGKMAAFISYRLKLSNILAYLFAILTACLVYMGLNRNIEITLKPYVLAMDFLYQIQFEYVLGLGYVENKGLFIIGKECLGGKLFICLFTILTICRLSKYKKLLHKIASILGFCIISIFLAYMITLIRISASIPFSVMSNFKLIHTILSLVIYFGSGIALYTFLSRYNKSEGEKRVEK